MQRSVWLRWAFGSKVGKYLGGFFTPSGLALWLIESFAPIWLWETLANFWTQSLGLPIIPMPHPIAAIILALIFGALVFGLFCVGAWWERLKTPKLHLDRYQLRLSDGHNPLENVHNADCNWVSGSDFFERGEHVHKIQKLLLPNPESFSIKEFQDRLPVKTSLSNEILETTRVAKEAGIAVKWHQYFTGQSWWIGDRGLPSCFVHIEVLLPFGPRERRPSFRVYSWQNPEFVTRHCEIFDKMWNDKDTIDAPRI